MAGGLRRLAGRLIGGAVGTLKPDAERRNRNPKPFGWTDLPAGGREGPPPKLPPIRKWSAATRAQWKAWWSLPQAVMWDPSGLTLHRLALLHEILVSGVARHGRDGRHGPGNSGVTPGSFALALCTALYERAATARSRAVRAVLTALAAGAWRAYTALSR